ncbi:MAG: histidine kinase [Oscillospiraceae bacterium]|nr:histidine kinase [Oscillospiraceae bacterium]
MKLLQKYNNLAFRYKLAIAFAMMIAFNTAISLYYSRQVKAMTDVITQNQQEYYQVNELSTSLEIIKQQLDIYIDQKRPAAYTVYSEERKKVENIIEQLTQKADATISESYSLRAIENATKNYIRECNLMFWQVNAGQPDSYMTYYRSQSTASYLAGYLGSHLNLILAQNAVNQSEIAKRAELSSSLNITMLTASALFCLIVTVNFSGYITRPISALAESAEKISDGDYDIPDLPVMYDDEVGKLTRSFNVMKKSVEASIEHLNKRAELEAQLHQKELENLRMSQLLHESQYLALQSQINPHFLFNTLNVIARTAVRGTPKTTTTLIYSLADLFRYNLNHMNNFSTLSDELEIVGKYIYIQKHRFGERIQYHLTAGGCENVRLPSMLLQPLVENAIIHGIEDLEEGGKIVIDARKRGEKMLLRVYDNGSGITKERLREIKEGRTKHTGHTTGIGLSNIIKRIEMIQGASIKIKSGKHGTMISIILPFEEKETADEI